MILRWFLQFEVAAFSYDFLADLWIIYLQCTLDNCILFDTNHAATCVVLLTHEHALNREKVHFGIQHFIHKLEPITVSTGQWVTVQVC